MTVEDAIYDPDLYEEDDLDLDDADLVEWYEPRAVNVSTPVAAGAIIAAFTLGVLTAVGALALMGRLDD